MRSVLISSVGPVLSVCMLLGVAGAQERVKLARDFFPGVGDGRKVVYIEVADDEVLLFDSADNDAYVLGGRALEIHAAHAKVKGVVVIRSFPDGSHGPDTSGVAPKGNDGLTGANGVGDGVGGDRGERGHRGNTGDPGGPGRTARRMALFIDKLDFDAAPSALKLLNSGEKGGKGQTGGQGGTGGRGGHGQDRECPGSRGPGNAGPRGAAGASGTGGQGGPGGNGGEIVLNKALFGLKGTSITAENNGGEGGLPGDPGALGLVGEPGGAGAGCGTDGGGDAKHIDPLPPDPYVPPSPSQKGQEAKIVCKDCN